jgi:hypothetical protein
VTPWLIVGSTVVGGVVGGLLGLWYGFATDTSDMPVMPIMTGPMGSAVGCVVGAVGGAVVFG